MIFNSSSLLQSVSAIYAGMLAMILYPEAAERARAEIDNVVGSDRLPSFSDRPHLPYVNAFIKEVDLLKALELT